jgi:DeoR/GlpR family transcriptional regulator of sugar metabolism
MSRSHGSRESRQQQILDHVILEGTATSAELAAMTDVSLMTIHRDVDELASRGLLRKYHGGISALPSTVFESSSQFRMRSNLASKDALAEAALALIEPGMSIMLDDSTTAYALAKRLGEVGALTVVTNYLPTIDLLKTNNEIHLIAIGGDYSRTHDSFLGVAAVESITAFNVDIVFLSTSAVDGSMTFHQEQAIIQVKRPMMAAATRRVLLMDRTKLDRTALYRLAPVAEFTTILVEEPVSGQIPADLLDNPNVTIVRAQPTQ